MIGGSFAFALPVTMFGFGCAFLSLWRWGAKPALAWSLGFLLGAAGFGTTLLTSSLPDNILTIVADGVFLLCFFFYGQGLLQRMGRGGMLWTRLAICILGLMLSAWSVLIANNLHLELVTNDLACSSLLALPLALVARGRKKTADRLLVGVSLLVVLDSVIRSSTVLATSSGSIEDFASTEYAFIMQATASVLSVALALTAMAALSLDLLSRYREEASTDPLSGLLNRRGFEEKAAGHHQSAEPSGSIISCDIDHFKRVNDRFGHAAGDAVIQGLAAIIQAAIPTDAIAARFGGEEFIIYLPSSNAADARRLAEEVRHALATRDWRENGINQRVTASLGISGRLPTDFSLHDGIGRADAALYEAKRAGRNQIVVKLTLFPSHGAVEAITITKG